MKMCAIQEGGYRSRRPRGTAQFQAHENFIESSNIGTDVAQHKKHYI